MYIYPVDVFIIPCCIDYCFRVNKQKIRKHMLALPIYKSFPNIISARNVYHVLAYICAPFM